LHSTGEFKDGEYEGTWKVYHQNGVLKQIGDYSKGKAEGFWKFYHENGRIWKYGDYVNDQKQGFWKYYTPERILERTVLFKNNKPDISVWQNKKGSDMKRTNALIRNKPIIPN